MSGKRYLMTPGPTPVPPEGLAALALPSVHHRGPDFQPLFARCLERLQRIYRTRGDALLLTASGTGAMESVVANLTAPGDRVLVVSAGNFGERWGAIADGHGCEVEWLRLPWGDTPTPDALGAKLGATGRVKVVFLTHSETSTGVVCDLQALAATVREAGPLVAVDAVSSLGAVPLETDAWGLDAVASGSQKALMSPPGLAMVAVSERAFAERAPARSYYFDWERIRSAQARLDSAFTPAVSLVAALDVALGLILEEIGLDAVWNRHARLGRACRAGLTAMGLELFSPDDDRAAVVTAAHAPEGVDATEVVRALRDRFGVTIANGQGELKGRIFRIGHIGYFDVFDITTTLSAVELALAELGADVERGAAAAAALEAFEHARV
jgi:aspartate aminotransferase-like enzyme